MTNFEAISARLYPYSVDDNLIRITCTDVGLSSEEEYSFGNKVSVAKATIGILKQLITLTSENIGKCSLGYNPTKIGQQIFNLAKDNNLLDIAEEFDTRSIIQDISDQW